MQLFWLASTQTSYDNQCDTPWGRMNANCINAPWSNCMLACVCILVRMWHLLNTNQLQLYNKIHKRQRLTIGVLQIVQKMEKLDIHDNKKWLFYIESQFTYQISNNKPKIIKSTNHWAYTQGNQCLYIIKTT